jgi:phosphoglycerate dehydrogenase-like enzyme
MPGVNANAVAELVVGFMISMTRTVPFYTREVVRGTSPATTAPPATSSATSASASSAWARSARRVARLAGAFGMSVQAYDPYIVADFELRASRVSFDELLATSDIVTLHVPLTAETRRMIGAAQIARLPRGSYVINASRGEVLDQNAALAALAETTSPASRSTCSIPSRQGARFPTIRA